MNNTSLREVLPDPLSKRNFRKQFDRNYLRQNLNNMDIQSSSRSPSSSDNYRRASRTNRYGSLSASGSTRGSRQSVHGRAASSDGRNYNLAISKRGRNKIRETLSAAGSEWGSEQSTLSDSNLLDFAPMYNHLYNCTSDIFSTYECSFGE